jgi:hypothetical protein
MGVPNTNTFSLQDVVDEVGPTTDDLVDCIADANSADYDSTYYTSPATSLLEFRNYAGTAAIVISSSGTSSTQSTTINFTLGTVPVGDMIVLTVFQKEGGSTVTTPSGYTLANDSSQTGFDRVYVYYKTNLNPTSQSVTISSSDVGYKILNVMFIENQSGWGQDASFATSSSTFTPSLTSLTSSSLVFIAWSTKSNTGGNPSTTLNMESGTGSSSVISGFPGAGDYRAYIKYYFQPSTTSIDRFASLTQGTANEMAGVMFEIKN